MALVWVYCGVAAAEVPPWLTVALVDDAGRLTDLRHVSDDPDGYAQLAALLADRDFLIPDDLKRFVVPAWAHRVRLTAEAEIEGATAESVVRRAVETVPVPH